MWELATETTWKDMKCPVLSRWEHVGEAIQHVVEYKRQWILVSQNIIKMNNVGTNKNDIASYIYSYLKEDVLFAQVLFVHGFYTGFFDKYLQWHKQICPKSNCAGFRAVDMGVNLYIMDRDLQELKTNWHTKEYMLPFIEQYPEMTEYKKEDMVSDFLNIVEHRMKKHMSQWKQRHLPFVLGGDALPAAYFANWILNEPQPEWMPHTYQSDIHKTVIDVRACGAFLVADENPETHQRKQFF